MLVLSRNLGERIIIGNNIIVTVLEIRGDRVRLGFEAPNDVPIHREELHRRMAAEQGVTGAPLELAGAAV
jgi:carbon storage regulator